MKKYVYIVEVGTGTLYGPFATAKKAEKWIKKELPEMVVWTLRPVMHPDSRNE